MAKTNKNIRYRIYGIIDFPPEQSGEIESILDNIREQGAADIMSVELVSPSDKLPEDLATDFNDKQADSV